MKNKDTGKKKIKPPAAAKKAPHKEDFFDRVYKVVAKIPYGKVTTYGHIAEACGIRSLSQNCRLGFKRSKGFRTSLS